MTDKEIEAIIERAIRKNMITLKAAGAFKDNKSIIYKEVAGMLTDYYKNDADNESLEAALEKIKTDTYFDIIPLYFYSNNTIEHIASRYDVDASTITRNKKRLCFELYELMGEKKDG